MSRTDPGHLRELSERLRAEFIRGAEERSQRVLGRPLTAAELERILRHYPGDWTRDGNVDPDADGDAARSDS